MAIVDRAVLADDVLAPDVEIPVDAPMEFPGGAEIIEDADGGVTIQVLLEDDPVDGMDAAAMEHGANLAEFIPQTVLRSLASDLTAAYEDDLQSRQEWEEGYAKGLDLLGIKYEERSEPFE